MNRYLLLSLCTGIFECGALVLALSIAEGLPWLGLLYGFSWQIGNALAKYARPYPVCQRLFELSFVLAAVLLNSGLYLAPVFASLAQNLQYVRGHYQDGSRVLTKRTYRVLGFVVGGLFYIPGIALFGWILCAILLGAHSNFRMLKKRQPVKKRQWSFMSTVMVFHQIHYFLYAYGIAWILHEKDNIPLAAVGAAFAAGWIIYLAVEPIFGKVNYSRTLSLGHVFVAAVLLLMSSDTANGYSTILWVATGLGGGTVYCIHRLGGPEAEMDLAEEIGHWVGPLLAITIFLVGFDWDTVLRVAAAFALLVSFCTQISLIRRQPG